MGDRAHLLTEDITVDTFVQDLAAVLTTEELSDVILVAHSFGGVPVTGVADRMPGRIRHLVYLDAVVLRSGQSAFSVYPQADIDARLEAANAATGGLAVPVPAALQREWGLVAGTPDHAWVMRRLTPTPLKAYTTALDLHGPIGNGLPRTYIRCTRPENPVLDGSRQLVRSLPGWTWIDFPGPHACMITHPDEVSQLLLGI